MQWQWTVAWEGGGGAQWQTNDVAMSETGTDTSGRVRTVTQQWRVEMGKGRRRRRSATGGLRLAGKREVGARLGLVASGDRRTGWRSHTLCRGQSLSS